jgi:hypothetical protein
MYLSLVVFPEPLHGPITATQHLTKTPQVSADAGLGAYNVQLNRSKTLASTAWALHPFSVVMTTHLPFC